MKRILPTLILVVAEIALAQPSRIQQFPMFLRGYSISSGHDIAVSLDGIPINEWSALHRNGLLDLDFVIPELVRETTVSPGPFKPEHGSFATAGAVDLSLGIPDGQRGWRSGYTVGSTNSHRGLALWSPRNGSGNDFVAVEAFHDDGYSPGRQKQFLNAYARYGFHLGQRSRIDLLVGGHTGRFQLPGLVPRADVQQGFVDYYDVLDEGAAGAANRAIVQLRHLVQGSDEHHETQLYFHYRHLDLTVNDTGFLRNPYRSDRREQIHQTYSLGLSGNYQFRVTPPLRLQFLLGSTIDVFHQQQDALDVEQEPYHRTADIVGFQGNLYTASNVSWRMHPTLEWEWGARADLLILRGLDLLNTRDRSHLAAVVSPRTILSWTPVAQFKLSASYGRGFRPAELRSVTQSSLETTLDTPPYPGPKPGVAISDTVELKAALKLPAKTEISLTGYALFAQDETVFEPVTGMLLPLGSSRRLGTDVKVSTSPLSWVTLGGQLGWVSARLDSVDIPVPQSVALTGSAHATMTFGFGLSAGAKLRAIHEKALATNAVGPGYTLLDIWAGYRWRWLKFGLLLENTLNQTWAESEYYVASNWFRGFQSDFLPTLHYSAGAPLVFKAHLEVQL